MTVCDGSELKVVIDSNLPTRRQDGPQRVTLKLQYATAPDAANLRKEIMFETCLHERK